MFCNKFLATALYRYISVCLSLQQGCLWFCCLCFALIYIDLSSLPAIVVSRPRCLLFSRPSSPLFPHQGSQRGYTVERSAVLCMCCYCVCVCVKEKQSRATALINWRARSDKSLHHKLVGDHLGHCYYSFSAFTDTLFVCEAEQQQNHSD